MKKLIFSASSLSAAFSFLICLFFNENIGQAFFLIPLYPLLYGLLFLAVWPYMQDNSRSGRITAGIFLVIQWLRCVLLPMLGAPSGYFSIESSLVDENAALTATWLFLFEMLVSFLTVYLILRFSKRTPQAQPQPQIQTQQLSDLRGRLFVYVVFVLFSGFLYLRNGQGMFSFFLLTADSTRAGTSQEEGNQILSALISFGLTFVVILSVYFCFKRYTTTGRSGYVYFALLIALLRVCLISSNSDGRLAILYPTGAFLLLLPKLFRNHARMIVRSILLVGIAVIGLMTVYKVFYAFVYDSYAEAIQAGMEDFGLKEAAAQIDIYFYGVQNIAKNLFVSNQLQLPMGKALEDLLRNTFGIHYLLKDSTQTTVELYNLYIYQGRQSSGHLFSSLAYGYTYLGSFLAVLATAFNIWFASFLEKFLHRTKHIDTFYILSIVYVRMAYTIFACFPMAWNNASRNLFLGFIIIGGASLLKHKWGTSRRTYRTLRST